MAIQDLIVIEEDFQFLFLSGFIEPENVSATKPFSSTVIIPSVVDAKQVSLMPVSRTPVIAMSLEKQRVVAKYRDSVKIVSGSKPSVSVVVKTGK
jgi:hypothetical protein